jgi:hypothetical protein
MTIFHTFIDDTVGLGSTTVKGIQDDGSEFGIGISSDIYANNIYANNIYSPNVTVGFARTSFDVIGGIGSITDLYVSGITTLGSTSGSHLDVNGNATFYNNVGIGSAIPQQRLDIGGSIKIDNLIYDVDGQAGQLGWFLTRDASGIRWTNIAPGFGANIIVLEEGNAITGTVGISSFSGVNFISGSGASAYELVDLQVNPINPLYADIYIKDFWTKNGSSVYRNSNVGINVSNPAYALDVYGSSNISQNLYVGGPAVLYNSLQVNSGAIIDGNLDVKTNLNIIGITSLSGFVLIDDNVIISGFTTGTISTSLYSNKSGISTYSDYSGIATYAINSGIATYADYSGIATYAIKSGISTYSDYSGISTYAINSGIATYADYSGIATYSDYSGIATYAINSGIATYADYSGIATYAIRAGISTYSDYSGISTYAINSGIATYADYSGIATYSDYSGISTYAINSGIATYADYSGIATYAIRAGIVTYSDYSGIATYSDYSGISTYAIRAGIATYSDYSGISTYAINSGISTYSDYSGISTYATKSGIATYSDTSGISTYITTVQTTNNIDYYIPFVQNSTSTVSEIIRVDSGIKYNPSTNSVNLDGNLSIGGTTILYQSVELKSSLIDTNGSAAIGKTDYRLASIGTGVSWRPPGVQTQNAIWVTMDGNDSNSGLLEGDAKRTVGAAAAIAQEGDTIFIRSGVYYENNPIGLRNDVSVSGQDLRLVTIVPNNPNKDVFHVRRGCLIENLNFAGSNISVEHNGCGAVAFPSTDSIDYAISGYIAPGPATEGSTGRWRSPYIRNCTNFMSKSIGMKINGDHATGTLPGADLKCMVCDSFTQYNENGIGVSITNNGYAQLVSIFTINCDIGIYCDSGGSCDLTNSNSSFGNYGLYAVGLGRTEFTGKVLADTLAESDIVGLTSVFDSTNIPRKPYDGQALWFKIDLNNYPDATGVGIITAPLTKLDSITVTNGGSGYSSSSPPSVIIIDADLTQNPKGPQGIIAQASATVDDASGSITAIDVINSGRNYLSSQDIRISIAGGATAIANMAPIYYTVSESTESTIPTGITTTTFNEFIPYELFEGDEIELKRISRILTSSHSFEYIGTGTSINTSIPLKGAIPIKANEVVVKDGAQIPFTSTDQKGNFDIGKGIQIDQTTSTIRGRDFSRAIQAEVTPLILALR